MIVQTGEEGTGRFVMTMEQHTDFAATLAEHFGNDQFASVEPRELMLYLVAHHDAGWYELDTRALRDPNTGLPYHLVQTPFEEIVKTSAASPDFNTQHHPFCGLLSSMHSWGLYNGRYGMSDKVLIDSLDDARQHLLKPVMDREVERQEALKEALRCDPSTAAWAEEVNLFHNYRQLQFFDTLALYFNCTPERAREPTTFLQVPMNAEENADVELQPLGNGAYALDPWPFAKDFLELSYLGRCLEPVEEGLDMRQHLESAPERMQSICLRRTLSE
jgi:hypothetical protein